MTNRNWKLLIVFCMAIGVIIFCVHLSASNKNAEVHFLLDWKMVSPYSPYLLAAEEGYFDEEGISISFVEGQGAETSAKLIGQGTYSIGTCNAAATATAIDNGVPIVSVAMIEQDAVTAVFSLAKTNIAKPEDLIGKTLGVRYYDISHKEYQAMMRAKNIDTTKVKEVNVGFELQPLLTGQVDALYNYAYNMPVVLKQQGRDVNLIFVKDNGVDGYGSNIIVNKTFAHGHEALVRRFIAAARKGWLLAREHPEKAIAVLKAKYPETDSAVALAILKEQMGWIFPAGKTDSLFTQNDDRWDKVIKTYKSLGLIKGNLSANGLFTNQYLN